MQLASVFGDHMVLQREIPIPVWGTAAVGEAVTVTLAGQQARTVADARGQWMLQLPAMPAGGPFEMTVSGASTLSLRDVMIGEVWVCSGQSNMEMAVQSVNDAEGEIERAAYPDIRLFTVPKHTAFTPETAVSDPHAWELCAPNTVPAFSAVGYFFGRELYQRLGVPIGLINTSWGGTVAETWTSREGLLAEPSLHPLLENLDNTLPNLEQMTAAYEAEKRQWELSPMRQDPGNSGWAQGWADPATDTTDWDEMPLPGAWQERGMIFSGVFWFRREVEIPAAWAGKDLTLSIGACDKSDVTYFNNVEMGGLSIDERSDAWCIPRTYTIPAALVQSGKNTIAVRVFSNIYHGGMTGPASQMHIGPVDASGAPISLVGPWRYQIEYNFGLVTPPPITAPAPPGMDNPNWATLLYNGMIAPLIPYAIRGAIWYQGESNADRGEQYRTLFPAMITDWRKRFAVGDFPFLFVQLANFMEPPTEPTDCQWAELREAQTMTLDLANTGMAVIIDIGEAVDIHPRNKQDVGYRLALNALANTYGMADLPYSGPLYTRMEVEGNAIRLFFDHTNGGLQCRGERLEAFAIAGEDRAFVWADAVIDGDTVLVSSPHVSAPVAARYGWANNPPCNLYNGANLPASPFRTDAWPACVPIGA